MEPSGPDIPSEPAKKRSENAPRPPSSTPLMLLVVLGLAMVGSLYLAFGPGTVARVDDSFFRTQLEAGNVEQIIQSGATIYGEWRERPFAPASPAKAGEPQKAPQQLPKSFTVTVRVGDETLDKAIQDARRAAASKKPPQTFIYRPEDPAWGSMAQVLFSTLLMVGMIGFMWYMFRRSSDPMGAGGMVSNFIRSPARRFKPTDQVTTFDDVAGMEQAKYELQEVVEFLKNPAKFQKLGAQIPKGVLLMGPPGTGKTLLSRATAGEAGVPFFSINGSEFIQMFVGVGASRVRDMFKTAKDAAPCILFIDEIDAVGRIRGAGVGGGHDEREQTLNQILSEMDGFTQSESVIVLAATNRPDVLDPALLRPGRFDRHITVDRPSKQGRLGILKVHTRKVPLADDVDLERIAGATIGFSGAELKNLVNEAALHAARTNKSVVNVIDFEVAKDRVQLGTTREEVLTEHEKEMTAYHEAGHAVIAWLLPNVDPVHKVSIIPRGRTGGVTQLLPDEERLNAGEQFFHSQLVVSMAGRAAEKIAFNETTAGVEGDIKHGTKLARFMVAHWGMSDAIGPVSFHQGEEHPFLGKEMHEGREFSEETARIIDQEVQRFLNAAAARATQLLTTHRDMLDKLARALIEREQLTREDLIALFGARPASEPAMA